MALAAVVAVAATAATAVAAAEAAAAAARHRLSTLPRRRPITTVQTWALAAPGQLLLAVAAAAAVAVALVLLAQVFAPHFLGVEVAATYLRGAVLGGRRRGLDSPLTLYTPSHHEKPRSQ